MEKRLPATIGSRPPAVRVRPMPDQNAGDVLLTRIQCSPQSAVAESVRRRHVDASRAKSVNYVCKPTVNGQL